MLRAPMCGPAPALPGLDALLPHMRGLSADSRTVRPGMGFAAFAGDAGDGRPWIADAVARGASVVLWEPEGFAAPASWTVPQLAIPGLATLASRVAARVYGDPSAHLAVIGVTGTNGKTSCTHWLAQALAHAGVRCGLIGTLGSGMPGQLEPTGFTTPGAVDLQARLATLRDQGATAVALEVSSHGLALGRVDGVRFDLALFTNLTRDHLDFHGSMEAYGAAKAALFRADGLRQAIINIDDGFGASLAARLRSEGVPVTVCSQQADRRAEGEAVLAEEIRFSPEETRFRCVTPQGSFALRTSLLGAFNVANLLAVIAALLACGVAADRLPELVLALTPPPGRLQRVGLPGGVQVVVDYAHTPDALEQVLRALRATLAGGRLICVFGCGGDRDPGKRPQMGAIAERLADQVVLTSDNPRSEDPQAILHQIAAGMQRPPLRLEPDRAQAIAQAVAAARPGDLVLIAGKGHETTQEIAGHRTPFSDLQHARRALGLAETDA